MCLQGFFPQYMGKNEDVNAAPEVPSQSSGAYFQTQTHLNCQNIVLPSRWDSSLRVWKPSLSSQFQLHKLTVQTGRLADSAAVCLSVGGWGGCLWAAATGPPTGLYKGDLALIYSGMIIRKWRNQPNRGSESFQRVRWAFFHTDNCSLSVSNKNQQVY